MPDLRIVVEPIMAQLVALTGESASFCVRNDDTFYCVAHSPSPHELRYSPTTDASYPLNSGAAGLAILAFLPQDERTALLTEHEFQSFTEATITARSELEAELVNTRDRGYRMSAGAESTPGTARAAR